MDETKKEMNDEAAAAAASDERRGKRFRRREDCESADLLELVRKKDEELVQLQDEINSLKDQMLRRQAEFENFKKRNLKQQDDFRKFAIKDLALDIITINDDLNRAMDASAGTDSSASTASVIEGVRMIARKIEDTLARYHVEEITALGEAFDPNVHEALEIDYDADLDEEKVTHVHQKGFSLYGTVLRSAKVKVTRPEASKAASND